MAKEQLQAKFDKPRVRFSKSGTPFTLVEDIFHSKKGQQIISRMATLRSRDERTGRFKPNREDE
jgi:hypothetical protein